MNQETTPASPVDQVLYEKAIGLMDAHQLSSIDVVQAMELVPSLVNLSTEGRRIIELRIIDANHLLPSYRGEVIDRMLLHLKLSTPEMPAETSSNLLEQIIPSVVNIESNQVLRAILLSVDAEIMALTDSYDGSRGMMAACAHIGYELVHGLHIKADTDEKREWWLPWMKYYAAIENALIGTVTSTKIALIKPDDFTPYLEKIAAFIQVTEGDIEEVVQNELLEGMGVTGITDIEGYGQFIISERPNDTDGPNEEQ